jgi:hypothetical protein
VGMNVQNVRTIHLTALKSKRSANQVLGHAGKMRGPVMGAVHEPPATWEAYKPYSQVMRVGMHRGSW